ncbi:hypothetical protein HDV57DRAFT_501714 [Trichoderma longibrachiatum]
MNERKRAAIEVEQPTTQRIRLDDPLEEEATDATPRGNSRSCNLRNDAFAVGMNMRLGDQAGFVHGHAR